MSKELDEFYKKYSARIIAMDDTPLVKVMDGGKFKLLSIEEYDNLKQKLAESEKKILELQEDSIRDNQIYNEQLAEQSDLIYHLKKQLNCDYYKPCPRCNNPYGASQFPSKDENGKDIYVCSNCNEKELFYEPLIKQLEDQNDRLIKERDDAKLKLLDKEKEIEQLKKFDDLNKTFFDLFRTAFKEPNKVDDLFNTLKTMQEKQNQDKISFCIEKLEKVKHYAQHIQGGLINYIDDQIKLLKEGT